MNTRVRVKICGLTSESDARAAIALGADALGFNLFPQSPRYIDLERDAAWIATLPSFVTRAAVLVNVPLIEALRIAAYPAIDIVQLHGDEDPAYCAALAAEGCPFIKAVRVKDISSLESLDTYSTPHILLDAHADSAYGGTGLRLDPALAAEAIRRYPHLNIILAGGLRPDNVAEAVRAVRPYAVDVASGVEASLGIKDGEKMAAFIQSVRHSE